METGALELLQNDETGSVVLFLITMSAWLAWARQKDIGDM